LEVYVPEYLKRQSQILEQAKAQAQAEFTSVSPSKSKTVFEVEKERKAAERRLKALEAIDRKQLDEVAMTEVSITSVCSVGQSGGDFILSCFIWCVRQAKVLFTNC
jgi:hypothetical protein